MRPSYQLAQVVVQWLAKVEETQLAVQTGDLYIREASWSEIQKMLNVSKMMHDKENNHVSMGVVFQKKTIL